MAKAVQPAIAPDEILLELGRFQLVDRRLELSGRWFGVRGRRFVRPTLTPLSGRDRSRVLADLEHKPWAAEDGEPWEASFPWDRNGAGTKFELSVAPDIVILLPSPSAKLSLPRRFAALPRQPSVLAVRSQQQSRPEESHPPAPAEVESSGDGIEDIALQLEASRAELEGAREELTAVREELASAQEELASAREELTAAAAARDLTAGEAAAAISARDQLADENRTLQTERDELRAAHEVMAGEREQLSSDLAASERTVEELRSELDRMAAAVEEATQVRDEAIAAHGAAIVMRRAARANPYSARSYGPPWRTGLAILALLAVVFAILIVLGVL